MKVNNVLAIAALISIASASSAFAQAATIINSAGADLLIAGSPSVTVKPSKNVFINYIIGTLQAPGSATYAIQSHHASGTKTYASSSGDTKIFMTDDTNPTGITATAAAPAIGSSMNSSAYTAM
jgi:hypothetical protein